jgi:phospholipid N-methyltransferase
MRAIDLARRPEPSEKLAFLRGFLRSPSSVGSVIPSSRFLERRIIHSAGIGSARVVVELGPGTGGTTRAILAALAPQAKLLCIERDPWFAEGLGVIEDRRLIVHRGDAVDFAATLADHGLSSPDTVISGIPFSTLPRPLCRQIAERIAHGLTPGGCFVAYQFRPHVTGFFTPLLGEHETSDLELRNVPPMRVYRWRKHGGINGYQK